MPPKGHQKRRGLQKGRSLQEEKGVMGKGAWANVVGVANRVRPLPLKFQEVFCGGNRWAELIVGGGVFSKGGVA